jgi:hypothetical protein
MPPVKGQFATLTTLLKVFSPWERKPLTYGELAERLGTPFTEDSVKSWNKRRRIPEPARDRILERAAIYGVAGLTMAWLRAGTGEQPRKGGAVPPAGSQDEPSDTALARMAFQRGGNALAKALQDAMERDEVNGSRTALKDFRRFIWTLAQDLSARGYDASAKEFMYLYAAITEQLEQMEGEPPKETKP